MVFIFYSFNLVEFIYCILQVIIYVTPLKLECRVLKDAYVYVHASLIVLHFSFCVLGATLSTWE